MSASAAEAGGLWQFSADTGGTFTDCIALDPGGCQLRTKVLSSGALRSRVAFADPENSALVLTDDLGAPRNSLPGFSCRVPGGKSTVEDWSPDDRRVVLTRWPGHVRGGSIVEFTSGEPAPVVGARLLTGTAPGEPFPPLDFRLATTKATNALLEHKLAPTVLFLTRGFGDLLRIGDQRRSDLFALEHHRPPLPCTETIEVDERVDAAGRVLLPLDEDSLESTACRLVAQGNTVAAVAFVHGDRHPAHERRAVEILDAAGFLHITASHEAMPSIRYLPRARTAAVNAALSPIMEQFIAEVREPWESGSLLLMTSTGGLEPASAFRPKDGLLSGPAGGVVGTAAAARAAGIDRFIAFDMGGTSTDVSRFDGDFPYQFEQRIGSAHLLSRSLKIETVAAGGGSICSLQPSGLTVGPESAGADPGPACYGSGGPLTLTDVNFLLGRLDPSVVRIPLDLEASRQRLEELKAAMAARDMEIPGDEDLLHGLLEIAVERMAEAIRRISVREGYDPSAYALLAFGGAGPQHACAVAERLGIRTVLIPADAGLLSAVGLRCASIERFASRQLLIPLAALDPGIPAELEREALDHLIDEGFAEGASIKRRMASLRLRGQDSTLTIDFDAIDELAPHFTRRFRETFGYNPPPSRPVEVVDMHVIARTRGRDLPDESFEDPREALNGPHLESGPFSTSYLAPGWILRRGSCGSLLFEQTGRNQDCTIDTIHPTEIEAELYRHRLASVVAEMGALLQRTAVSTNVKEREDYSCAVLDEDGNLVVNAPHIPVHLGAMGICVRRVAEELDLGPGDIAITNHPAYGGSHLPDVTVITPVFDANGRRFAYLANRAHHAEIGGLKPGSMPANARSLAEEGVVLAPIHLYRGGIPDFDRLRSLLLAAPFPTRAVEDNIADIKAQCAALFGAKGSLEAMDVSKVRRAMRHILEFSSNELRRHLARHSYQDATAKECLDDGSIISVTLTSSPDGLLVDFAGTEPGRHPGNLNATPAIVRSAVLYTLRLWVQGDIPLNEGLLRNVEIRLPASFLDPGFPPAPEDCPAVVGGNVETSQRVVDCLLRALHLQACSQGTMNNLIFGSNSFGYYETIAGGAGGGPGYPGADALHTHMTNTAITDVEILEVRYPVRLRKFAVREGSGGKGRWPGGNGVIRELEFLEPLDVSLLTQHRKTGPYGLEGGGDGHPGKQLLQRQGEKEATLDSIASFRSQAGDVLVLKTPGGGAWGDGR